MMAPREDPEIESGSAEDEEEVNENASQEEAEEEEEEEGRSLMTTDIFLRSNNESILLIFPKSPLAYYFSLAGFPSSGQWEVNCGQ